MGWWKIKDIDNKAKSTFVEGDVPADIMTDALSEINKLYMKHWKRPANEKELLSVFKFCIDQIDKEKVT